MIRYLCYCPIWFLWSLFVCCCCCNRHRTRSYPSTSLRLEFDNECTIQPLSQPRLNLWVARGVGVEYLIANARTTINFLATSSPIKNENQSLFQAEHSRSYSWVNTYIGELWHSEYYLPDTYFFPHFLALSLNWCLPWSPWIGHLSDQSLQGVHTLIPLYSE